MGFANIICIFVQSLHKASILKRRLMKWDLSGQNAYKIIYMNRHGMYLPVGLLWIVDNVNHYIEIVYCSYLLSSWINWAGTIRVFFSLFPFSVWSIQLVKSFQLSALNCSPFAGKFIYHCSLQSGFSTWGISNLV